MKRANSSGEFQAFLAQKKLRVTSEPRKKLRAELKEWLKEGVVQDLKVYQETHAQECAFNPSHENPPFKASHYGKRDLTEIAESFISLYPGSESLMPRTVWQETYGERWREYHRERAQLRILCRVCHTQTHPEYKTRQQKQNTPLKPEKKTKRSINDLLVPYNEKTKKTQIPHPWLDIKTWSPAPKPGNYVRKLGSVSFQLYARHGKWLYVHGGKFSEKSYASLDEVLRASYAAFGTEIRQFV